MKVPKRLKTKLFKKTRKIKWEIRKLNNKIITNKLKEKAKAKGFKFRGAKKNF